MVKQQLPAPIFNSGFFLYVMCWLSIVAKWFTNSWWRLPSASLEALQPWSTSLKSVQTWSASATQMRHTQGLSSTFRVKCEDFGGCTPSEQLFFRCFGKQHGRNWVTSNAKSSTPVNWEVKWTGYGSGKWMNQRAMQQSVYETDPKGIHLCWNQISKVKIKDKISGCPHRTNGWVATIQDLNYIL